MEYIVVKYSDNLERQRVWPNVEAKTPRAAIRQVMTASALDQENDERAAAYPQEKGEVVTRQDPPSRFAKAQNLYSWYDE